jgi:Domain of unknown function (DUF4232)
MTVWAGVSAPLSSPWTGERAGVRACTTSGLRIRRGLGGAGLGNVFAYIGFINTTHSTCRLTGWPRVVAVTAGGATSTARRIRATMFGPSPKLKGVPKVILRPGERADAVVAGSDNPGPGMTRCPPAFRYLRVTPPENSRSELVSAWLPGLAAYFPACSPIYVTMVVPAAALFHG